MRTVISPMAALLLGFSLSACAGNEAWTTPLAPPRAAREATCPVVLTEGPAPAGAQTLAIERCEYTGFGESCHELARRHACALGGNIIYGLHWEAHGSGRRHTIYVVGTIGVDPAQPGS